MTTPTPEPAHEGPLKRAEEWVESHIRPELADARIKAEQAIAFVRSHAQQADALGGILVRLVKAIDPAEGSEAAAILADAEQWAAEAARIAESVLAVGA